MFERYQVCSFVACAMHLWEDIGVINQGPACPCGNLQMAYLLQQHLMRLMPGHGAPVSLS